ncbi:MAG: right-handed parallel beta-helix repeat-containing protein [candidate division Zixibacteria bacterium]|nr:right-handed parallel beta-helix repeat-containing protein [candidate division Zixibacteria bacterium]
MFRVSMASIIIGLLFLAFSSTFAQPIHVPGDYATIQEAINAAVNYDTIMVAPGIYRVNLDFLGKAIALTSEAGPALTELWPADTTQAIIKFITNELPTAKLIGFTVGRSVGAAGIRIAGSSPSIIGNYFTHHSSTIRNGAVLYINGLSCAIIKNNLFFNNLDCYAIIWGWSDTALQIVNNTIHTGRIGLVLRGPGSQVMNNIVTGCNMGVSVSVAMSRGYNDIWGNVTDWILGSPDPTDISADPKYLDTLSNNFDLPRSSPCIDAGNPNAIYNDQDGTRNDIGAFSFDQWVAAVYNIRIAGENIAHLINHTPTFEWSYYDTVDMIQIGYEVTVGDISTSDIWTSGQVTSSDSFAAYGGPALTEGATYYCLIRVFNGHLWGYWRYLYFRMNAAPSVPVALWPFDIPVSTYGVHLLVQNSSDANGDPLTYDFEIAPSPGGTAVASRYDVFEQPSQTGTGIFKQSWPTAVDYVWQARAFDGYEYSDWSAYQPFVTREPMIIRVPSERPTIQAGIDAGQERDTVLVAPGTYTGDGNRDLSLRGTNLILKSETGAENTIIDCEAGPMNAHWGFYLRDFEDSTAAIDGFTIKNSFTDELGAIYITTSSPTIQNCIITENDGTGIMAVSNYGRWAGRTKVYILNCKITENNYHGIYSFAHATINNCEISGNALDGVHFISPDSVNMTHCLLRGNGQNGLYITIGAGGNYHIENNTFVGNNKGLHFYYEPPKAGAETSLSLQSNSIASNIFAFNRQYGVYASGMGITYTACNNAFGNPTGDWFPGSTYLPHAGDSLGNISADPLFCDTTTGDFHIAAISPCAPGNNSCDVLMGAFGIGCDFICGDVDGDGIVNIKDITYLIDYLYKNGPPPVMLGLADVNDSGQTNIQDITYLIKYLYLGGPPPHCP